MKWCVVGVYPEIVVSHFSKGSVSTAFDPLSAHSLFQVSLLDVAKDLSERVDGHAFGPSDGMVLKYDVLAEANLRALNQMGGPFKIKRWVLSPKGELWSQSEAERLSQEVLSGQCDGVILFCGRSGGFDQRFLHEFADREVSVGNYILSGGEIAASVVMDSTMRLIPGVLGNSKSAQVESFTDHFGGGVEPGVFTHPRKIQHGASVPGYLLSGHHKMISNVQTQISQVDSWIRGHAQELPFSPDSQMLIGKNVTLDEFHLMLKPPPDSPSSWRARFEEAKRYFYPFPLEVP